MYNLFGWIDGWKRGKNLDFSSDKYKKGDGTQMGGDWWTTKGMQKTQIVDEDINNTQSWDSKAYNFRYDYPDGYNKKEDE